jgi:hypothetical protein
MGYMLSISSLQTSKFGSRLPSGSSDSLHDRASVSHLSFLQPPGALPTLLYDDTTYAPAVSARERNTELMAAR